MAKWVQGAFHSVPIPSFSMFFLSKKRFRVKPRFRDPSTLVGARHSPRAALLRLAAWCGGGLALALGPEQAFVCSAGPGQAGTTFVVRDQL